MIIYQPIKIAVVSLIFCRQCPNNGIGNSGPISENWGPKTEINSVDCFAASPVVSVAKPPVIQNVVEFRAMLRYQTRL